LRGSTPVSSSNAQANRHSVNRTKPERDESPKINHRLGASPDLLYVKAIAQTIGKWQVSTPQGAKTPESILMKLGMVDHNFGGGSAMWVVSANM